MEGQLRSFPDKEDCKNTSPPNQHYKIYERDYYKKSKDKSERERNNR